MDLSQFFALFAYLLTISIGGHRVFEQPVKDALTLPLEELRAKRYANYQMEPNQWTFGQLLNGYYHAARRTPDGHLIHGETDGFLEAIKQPEAVPALEKALAKMEESIQYGTGD